MIQNLAMAEKKLSAIEFTVLGIAWKRGPCTTYAIMKELASSTSTYYKSRAGTAYPIVTRLFREGLLAYEESKVIRGDRLVLVTPAGEGELRQWLADPIGLEEVSHTMDFVRLRVFYLGASSPEEREAVLDNALSSLKRHLDECTIAAAEYARIGDVFSVLATEGVMFETRARIEWIHEIRSRAIGAAQGKPAKD